MRKYFFILLLALSTSICGAQSFDDARRAQVTQATDVAYRLFPTSNMWNFLKLDTRTGRIWMVQYSTKGDASRFETILSIRELASKSDENIGRFTLVPTSNMWNFILLDQKTGATYQVQWSTNYEERGIWPINQYGNE